MLSRYVKRLLVDNEHLCRRLSTSTLPVLDPVQEALLTEPCILVDENDKATGSATKRDCHAMSNGTSLLHRAFSLFIFNDNRELLLQQRSDTKITFPSLWTNTCCSHPLAVQEELEESKALGVRRAAQRRVNIELGISSEHVPVEDILYLTRILYKAPSSGEWGEHELDYILFLKAPKLHSVVPNPEEVQAIEWVSEKHLPEFLKDLEERNVGITPWFRLITKNLLPHWWKNLDHIEKLMEHDIIHKFN